MDHEADAHRTDLMTLTRHVLNEQSKYPESKGDFTILLSHIVLGCKFVCSAVNKVFIRPLTPPPAPYPWPLSERSTVAVLQVVWESERIAPSL